MLGSLDDFRLFLLSSGYAKKTVDTCLDFISSYLSINEFTNESVVKYIASLKDRGIANTTINRYIAHFKTYAKYREDSTLDNLRFFKVEQNFTKKILTDDEVKRFLEVPRNKFQSITAYETHQLFWTIAVYCGLRMSEISNLKPSNFDFDHWEINVENTKTYMSRKVPIAHIIRDYIFTEVSKKPPNEYVCNLTKTAWNQAFRRRLAKAGIKKTPNLSAYSLRHTLGTNVVKTSGILVGKQILGHKKLSTTEIYSHLDIQQLHDAINIISYAKRKLDPKEKIEIFLRDVVKAFFWDESEFDLDVKKRDGELELKIKARTDL